MFRQHDHDHDDDERERQLTDVVTYMVRAYCHGMGIDEMVITVHAHEDGAVRDRMLTLHVATGPDSAARLAAQAVVSDLASATFPAGAKGGPR